MTGPPEKQLQIRMTEPLGVKSIVQHQEEFQNVQIQDEGHLDWLVVKGGWRDDMPSGPHTFFFFQFELSVQYCDCKASTARIRPIHLVKLLDYSHHQTSWEN